MPAVFVHGVPDTSEIWNPLLSSIRRSDVACLSLPGFGNKRPDGFAPNKDTYADWLVSELRKIDGPIDLVGHDWGQRRSCDATPRRAGSANRRSVHQRPLIRRIVSSSWSHSAGAANRQEADGAALPTRSRRWRSARPRRCGEPGEPVWK
ncbi:MAG: alpha/beta hydrolase [Acidimicrobiia bacterium]|nr:alpha/beta hydrolase [Acidimicrobiia bacterium]